MIQIKDTTRQLWHVEQRVQPCEQCGNTRECHFWILQDAMLCSAECAMMWDGHAREVSRKLGIRDRIWAHLKALDAEA